MQGTIDFENHIPSIFFRDVLDIFWDSENLFEKEDSRKGSSCQFYHSECKQLSDCEEASCT